MTGQNFADLVRFYTKTNSTTFTDTQIVLVANTVKDDLAKEIVKTNEHIFGIPETTNLRASDSDDITKREYKLPYDDMKVIKVEAMPDGETWIPFDKFDFENYVRPMTETEVLNSFANIKGQAFWDKFRNSIWLYCGEVSDVTDGLKIYHVAYPADITTSTLSSTNDLAEDPTTTSAGMPRQFHELWARKVAIVWKSSREQPIPLSDMEVNFDRDFQKALDSIDSIDTSSQTASIPDDTDKQY